VYVLRLAACLLAVAALCAGPFAQERLDRPTQADGIVRLLADLENALTSGRVEDFRALASPAISGEDEARFSRTAGTTAGATAIVRERSRRPVGTAFEVIADLLISRGRHGRIATWQLAIAPGATPDRLELANIKELAAVDGLLRLTLDATRQFAVKDLELTAPDLTLRMAEGTAFVAESDNGVTALVLRGKGDVRFAPTDPAEQGQLRLFARRPEYTTQIDSAFVRLNPAEFVLRVSEKSLVPGRVNPLELGRAQQIFDDLSRRTYNIDLRSLTPEHWSLEPSYGSLVVEFKRGRQEWLTYARSPGEPEDISFFDRARGRNISVYASTEKLAERGRFYSEDDDETYDVEHYGLDLEFDPGRAWISGRGSLAIRIKASSVSTLTIKLAQPLTVTAVSSPTFGYLLALRIVGQNNVLVTLPRPAERGEAITLDVLYNGRLDPQGFDREALAPEGQAQTQDPLMPEVVLAPEPRFMYSNRVHWYPQGAVSDFATATMELTVPSEYQIVASGSLVKSTLSEGPAPARGQPRFVRTVQYVADRPLRYVSCVISRFVPVGSMSVEVAALAPPAPTGPRTASEAPKVVNLEVISTPRMASRNRQLPARVASIIQFYAATIGEAPYPDFTLAAIDDNLPGGHSPAFLAVFHQPLPTTPYSWAADPVAFDSVYTHFFLAHEVAHQWWGQGVGWKNYHEQWLSEGLSQYFAVLYAAHDRGDDMARLLLTQMRQSAASRTSQGPIALGYRLGHVQADGRVFRDIVYNKSAVVLHMLRRLIGDEAFFAGVRSYYRDWRFKKAGTDDLRRAFDEQTPLDLTRFFDRWIFGSSVPRLRVTSRASADGSAALVRVEQLGEVHDLPLSIQLQYTDGTSEDVILKVLDQVVEERIPTRAPLRRAVVRDDLTLATIVR